MTDRITPEQRSKVMQSIKAQSNLENLVAKELYRSAVRYRRNVRRLIGSPDVAIEKYRIVIFIDSCFWHSCPVHGKRPKSNVEFWNKKLDRNMEKAVEVNAFYNQKGWHILRIWEHENRGDFEATIDKIINVINDAKKSTAQNSLSCLSSRIKTNKEGKLNFALLVRFDGYKI